MSSIGKDRPVAGLFEEGFKAVYLAVGAQNSMKMKIENEDAEGVLHGIDYLGLLNCQATGQDRQEGSGRRRWRRGHRCGP